MRKIIGNFFSSVLAATVTIASAGTGFGADTSRPNIIYILADDLGYGDLSCLGQEVLSTPHIDRLRAEGMLFTNHYAGSAVCGPSRGSLIAGQHTGHSAIRGNKHTRGIGVTPLDPDVPTLPETVKNGSNYTTAMFGRWHCGGELSDQTPYHRGFDTHWGKLSSDFKNKHGVMIDALWDENGKHVPRDKFSSMGMEPVYENGKLANLSEADMKMRPINLDELVTLKAVDYIGQKREQPFFMYVAYNMVHGPMEYHEKYAVDDKNWPPHERAFASMLAALDDYVRQIVDAVDAAGMKENTVIMFASDNGAHNEDGHKVKYFKSNGAFRDYKRAFYDGGFRSPFIVRWPGVVKAGSTSDHLSAFWDIMPTACDIAGATMPAHTDGISFLPTLKGTEQKKHEYLYWEFNENSGSGKGLKKGKGQWKQGVRWKDWKAIYRIEPDHFELYNLKDDPAEANNVAAEHPELVEQIRGYMAEAHTPNERFPLLKSERE